MSKTSLANAINALYGKTQLATGPMMTSEEKSCKPQNPIVVCAQSSELAYPDGFRMRFTYVKLDENRAKVEADLRTIDTKCSRENLQQIYNRLANSNDESFKVVVWTNEPKISPVDVGERVAGAESVYQFNGTYTLEFDLRFDAATRIDIRSVLEQMMQQMATIGLKFSIGYYVYVETLAAAQVSASEKASLNALNKATAIANSSKAKIVLPAYSTIERQSYYESRDSDQARPRAAKAEQYVAETKTVEKSNIMIGRPTPQEISITLDVMYQTE